MNYLNLSRRFVERDDYDQEELISAKISGKFVGWDSVLQNRCSVIVAPANFGKTTEMQQKARELRATGHAAAFVALRRLAERGTLDKALANEERDAFRAWQAAPVNTFTVFVDSLDEAAAGKQENIGYLVRDVAQELGWPNEQVRWVVSSRPAVLTSDVYQELTQLLTKSIARTRVGATKVGTSSNAIRSAVGDAKLHLFSMAPLDDRQAVSYLNGRYLEIDAAQLVSLANERGLTGFARSPGGLDILARIDIMSNPPNSLTELYDRVVSAIEVKIGDDPRLADVGRPSLDALSSAMQRLAAASQVCQRVNIEMPKSSLAIPPDAISARLITAPLLDEAATRQLLGSQLFIDVGFHQVKFYPDELLPYLAAKRLAGLVDSLDQAERLLDYFSWGAPSGEQGVQRVYLPIMGWLATLNAHCREVILRKEPQALAFFGDLRNSAVPLAAAQEALSRSIERWVKQGDQPGRGMFSLTSENYWQAGPERMVSTISKLYDEYKDHDLPRQVLTDIATVCKLDILRGRVLRRHGSNYEQLLSDYTDVGYLLALKRFADIEALAAAALASATVSDSVIGLLLRDLGWNQFSPKEIAVLLDDQFAAGPRGFYISYALEESGILASATYGQLYLLATGLVVRLVKSHVGHPGVRNCDNRQYVDSVATVLETLISRTTSVQATQTARLYLVFRRTLEKEFLHSTETDNLTKAVSRSVAVRRGLLKWATQRNLDDNDLWMNVVGHRCAIDYSDEDIKAINHPQLTRVYSKWKAEYSAHTGKLARPKRKMRQNEPTVDGRIKRRLRSVLSTLRDGTETASLGWIANWLLQTNPASRYGDVNFSVFEKTAGMDIADAARQGMSCLWRAADPRFDEDSPRSTYYVAAASLQGLHLELGDGTQLPSLSDDEVRRALRYGLIEINGYPKWFWPLVEARSNVAGLELVAIVREASNGAASKAHAEELLASTPDAPVVVREALASSAWEYLVGEKPTRKYIVSRLLKAALSFPAKVPRKEFGRIALRKMQAAFRSPLPAVFDALVQEQRSEALAWAVRWLIFSPLNFRNEVRVWGPKDPLAVKAFIFDLAADLGRDKEGVAAEIAKAGSEGVMALEDLFLWTRWAVDPIDDPKHPAGVPYRPGPRDDAASFRSAILDGIAQANSQAAYDALGRICDGLPPDDVYVDYLKRARFELRERQFTREPLAQIRYDQFERDFLGDLTGATSFAMAVHSDLRAVQYDIERGEHSLRSFFNGVDFKKINKCDATGEQAGLALEVNFQRLLASELNHHARGRYSVTMESHTAEAKRRDVLCSRNDWRASIELKMSERWTLQDYIVALERQLLTQYMRHSKATVGFLVLVLQKSRHWRDVDSGKRLNFQDVVALLVARAQILEAQDRSRYLRIIGIDATEPNDFRVTGQPKTRR
ncbi:hypothetical protein L524_1062 [Bordetella bronchiseptica MBORD762]|uniref:hypothetical protein n=1 Tax=Bordetella bronchiseptica TaxID=518 RepID=UPI0004615787|nr:hypothetical protein [Bordetella bronchiseptica]KDD93236.1 hypothetical protein L524_1062 [Bordetella bronchiseptica MBORD762]